MVDFVKRLNAFFARGLWYIDVSSLDGFKAFLVKLLRLTYSSAREFSEGEVTLRAMSLVYTTLLSLVPLLAFSFSVLKAFDVHNQLEPLLLSFLAPLGPQASEITESITEFVENMKVGVLGSIGLALLVYTVISLIQKIEDSLNHIWKIKKSRSFARRFSDYISTLLVGPILIFSAISLTATVKNNAMVREITSIEPFGTTIYFISKLAPYALVSLAFTFIYAVMPNTKVRLRSALLGGVVAGVLWQTVGWGFASFVSSSRKYAVIYSGFAVLILFMIWIYLNWLILLLGAVISFCHQNLKFLTLKREAFRLSNRLKEKLSFLIMFLIGYNYYHSKDPFTFDSLVDRLGLPEEPVQSAIIQLENRKLITETGDSPPTYLPARDIETIKLKEVLDSARVNKDKSGLTENRFFSTPEVDRVTKRVDDAIEGALGEETLKSLILANDREI